MLTAAVSAFKPRKDIQAMKYGINLLLWTAGVTEEHFPLLAELKKWGYDGVEIPLFDSDESTLRRLRSHLDSLGLAANTACCCGRETNPISDDPAIRHAALDHMKQRIDWSALLGAEVLAGPFHSAIGAFCGRGRNESEWGWCVEYLRACGAYAEGSGLKLSVEPLNRFEAYFLNTMADSDRLVREVDHPLVGYLYDTFHANIEERDIARSVTDNAGGINHVHISENHRGVPGTGHVHWDETFRALKDCKYQGWLTVESFGRALPELAAATCIWRELFDSEADVAIKGLAFMKSKWDGV